MSSDKKVDPPLVFALNGERVEVPAAEVDPATTLNDFIRSKTKFKGTKIGCGEGGCGACAVVLSRIDASTHEPVYVSVNSCLRPLASMDGWAITTTEGLGAVDSKAGLHPVQERLMTMNATQCGFCTPGMVCTLYGKLKQAQNKDGSCGATMADLEATYDGNICRCTGYRPILDAAKTFAKDTDIEDLVTKTTPKGDYDHKKYDPEFPAFLKTHKTPERACFQSTTATGAALKWVRVSSVADVWAQYDAHKSDGDVKLIWSNTGSGIFKFDTPRVLVDISGIPSLMRLDVSASSLTIGCGYSLTAFLNVCKMLGEEDAEKKTNKAPWAQPFYRHVMRIANTHVRNVGTIGGNITMAKVRGFQSDLSTLLLGVGASVTYASAGKADTTTSWEKFLNDGSHGVHFKGLLLSITIPFNTAGAGASTPVFASYKTSVRPENSHPLLNAAFSVRLKNHSDAKGTTAVFDADHPPVLAYGGVAYGTPGNVAVRALKTELALKGQPVNEDTLQAALAVLGNEFKISGERADYRQRMVTSLFYKFFVALLGGKTSVPVATAGALSNTARPIVVAHQNFSYDEKEHAPISKPLPKVEGGLQCSGEAVFVDDLPFLAGELYGAVVGTREARGVLRSIDAKQALGAPGVVRFISATDVAGENIASPFREDRPVFLAIGKAVLHFGQPLGLIVADSKQHAEAAAKLVTAVIETKKEEPPITTLKDAIDKKSFFEAKKDFKTGDYANVKSAHTAKGVVSLGSQQHFYMETQVSAATNDEDGAVIVHSSTQWADANHGTVARALGLPLHRIKIVHRRAGGGFGGKLSHQVHVSCMAAVAARTLKKPVRVMLSRAVDQQLCGGREETEAEYEVKFDAAGKIEGFKMQMYKNSGCTTDFSFFALMAALAATNQVYYIPNYEAAGQLVKTNLPPRTVVRGPGEIEASYVMETVIEHIAHVLNKPSQLVREANFYDMKNLPPEKQIVPNGKKLTHYTIPVMWPKLKAEAKFDARSAEVAAYNASNRFTKRGIAMTPVRYEVTVWNRSALVNIYGDGSVVISHSGTEIGQGLNTKAAQMASYALGKALAPLGGAVEVPMQLIRFDDLRSDSIPNASFTGGSTGSEATAECVRRCAEQLVTRLAPVIEKMMKDRTEKVAKLTADGKAADAAAVPAISWADICAAAKGSGVNLSAQADWSGSTPDTQLCYQNFGCAVSEVELDVLTGEVKVLQTDMMYDAGKSLNPAVDIGQCEGAYMMGIGYLLREEVNYEPENGKLINDNTWSYKPAMPSDVPRKFNISLLKDVGFEPGILKSKCSGEPPLVLATSVAMAIRQAVQSARSDAGKNTEFIPMQVPCTLDVIQSACAVAPDALSLASVTAAKAKSK